VFSYKNSLLITLILSTFTSCNTSTPKVARCAYMPKVDDNISSEFSAQGVCGTFSDEDTLVLYPKYFKNLNFNGSSLATIYVNKDGEKSVFYVSQSGKVVRTFFFDNGADYFEEGLARTISKGKIGFINEKLEVVIEPVYDFASPFHNRKAKVCNGCTKKIYDGGEHWGMVGGKWGVIDTKGKLISPMK